MAGYHCNAHVPHITNVSHTTHVTHHTCHPCRRRRSRRQSFAVNYNGAVDTCLKAMSHMSHISHMSHFSHLQEEEIQKAIFVGNYDGAVDTCLKAGRLADALLIANIGGAELFKKTMQRYMRRNPRPYMAVRTRIGQQCSFWRPLVGAVCVQLCPGGACFGIRRCGRCVLQLTWAAASQQGRAGTAWPCI
jgi:hypothetical protein